MKNFLLILFTLSSVFSFAQYNVSGIISGQNNEPLAFAGIHLDGTFVGTTSGTFGKYQVSNLKDGEYVLVVQYVGYEIINKTFIIQGKDLELDLKMLPSIVMPNEVIIEATRMDENQVGSYKKITKDDLIKVDFGQDMPFLLNQTPSLVVTSDAGAGVGYTGVRIRGSDATRINVTINGIPLNDSESHGVYWVDIPDIAGSTDNIQIQRGIGSSTNGAGAFGGSINLLTTGVTAEPYAKYESATGSFNTFKNSVSFGTGLLNEKFAFDGKISRITSDGFIDRASSELKSYYLSGGYFTEKTMVKAIVFGGFERTYQAWNGVPQSKFEGDTAAFNIHYENAYYSNEESDNILNAKDETYNFYTYKNQVDNYNQDHFQLHLSHQFTDNVTATGAVHYTYGRGYYEQYRSGDDLADYGLTPIMTASDSSDASDVVRRKWLDNDFYGFTGNINYTKSRIAVTLGGAWNKYDGDHYGNVIWAQRANENTHSYKYYDNKGVKTDANVFVKATYNLSKKLSVTGDLQQRLISYEASGLNSDRGELKFSNHYSFFNPKVALNYLVNANWKTFLYVGHTSKEPTRGDFKDAVEDQDPSHEEMTDYELGVQYRNRNLVFDMNSYFMDYTDQLVMTGALNDVGDPIRVNVDDSYRAGVEVAVGWQILKNLSYQGNITLSENKIKKYNEFLYDYTTGYDIIETEYNDAIISFSPSIITSNSLEFSFRNNFSISLIEKFVGKQYLDNTASDAKSLDSYLVSDLVINYRTKISNIGEINIGFKVNNLLNEKYASNGYTYSYKYFETITENFVYPQAGRNYMVKLSVSF